MTVFTPLIYGRAAFFAAGVTELSSVVMKARTSETLAANAVASMRAVVLPAAALRLAVRSSMRAVMSALFFAYCSMESISAR